MTTSRDTDRILRDQAIETLRAINAEHARHRIGVETIGETLNRLSMALEREQMKRAAAEMRIQELEYRPAGTDRLGALQAMLEHVQEERNRLERALALEISIKGFSSRGA